MNDSSEESSDTGWEEYPFTSDGEENESGAPVHSDGNESPAEGEGNLEAPPWTATRLKRYAQAQESSASTKRSKHNTRLKDSAQAQSSASTKKHVTRQSRLKDSAQPHGASSSASGSQEHGGTPSSTGGLTVQRVLELLETEVYQQFKYLSNMSKGFKADLVIEVQAGEKNNFSTYPFDKPENLKEVCRAMIMGSDTEGKANSVGAKLFKLLDERKAEIAQNTGSGIHIANVTAERLEKVVRARQKAANSKPSRYFCYTHMKSAQGNAFEMISEGLFIDKSAEYARILFDSLCQAFSVIFPQRFGKTTLLSFIKSALSACWGKNDEQYLKFLNRLHSLEKGDEFLRAPIHPVIRLSLGHVNSVGVLSSHIRLVFADEGIDLTDIVYDNPVILLDNGLRRLTQLWTKVAGQLKDDVANFVDPKPILLIDEFDKPSRDLALNELTQRSNKEELTKLLNVLTNFGTCIKEWQEHLFRTVTISLLRTSGTGMSRMDIEDATRKRHYHGLVGVTTAEITRMFENLYDRVDKKFSVIESFRTRKREKMAQLAAELDEDDPSKIFYYYLKKHYNGFCFAVDDSKRLTDLYNPFDIYYVLFELEGDLNRPGVQTFFEKCRLNYGEVIKRFIKTKDVESRVDSLRYLAGGSLPAGDLKKILGHDTYFECHPEARHAVGLRLYLELGLLSVQQCCPGTPNERNIILGPSTPAFLEDKYEIISSSIRGGAQLPLDTVARLAIPENYIAEFSTLINRTWRLMQALYRDYKELREYDAQTQFAMAQKLEWQHPLVTVTAEE